MDLNRKDTEIRDELLNFVLLVHASDGVVLNDVNQYFVEKYSLEKLNFIISQICKVLGREKLNCSVHQGVVISIFHDFFKSNFRTFVVDSKHNQFSKHADLYNHHQMNTNQNYNSRNSSKVFLFLLLFFFFFFLLIF
jgi:hypothetical protein